MESDPMILPPSLPSLFAIAFSLLAAAPVPGDAAPFDPRTIVFIGSSSIEFWKSLPEDFAGHKVINLGKAGTTYSHLVAHAGEWGAKYPADRYVIYSGDNDIAWLRSPAKVAGQFREVARALKVANPRVHIFVISIKPNVIPTRRIRIGAVRKANAMIAADEPPLSPGFRWGGFERDEKGNPYQSRTTELEIPPQAVFLPGFETKTERGRLSMPSPLGFSVIPDRNG
jgi:hypothetical protein